MGKGPTGGSTGGVKVKVLSCTPLCRGRRAGADVDTSEIVYIDKIDIRCESVCVCTKCVCVFVFVFFFQGGLSSRKIHTIL